MIHFDYVDRHNSVYRVQLYGPDAHQYKQQLQEGLAFTMKNVTAIPTYKLNERPSYVNNIFYRCADFGNTELQFLGRCPITIPSLLSSFRVLTIAEVTSQPAGTILAFHANRLVAARQSRGSRFNRKLIIHDFQAFDAANRKIKVTLFGGPLRDYVCSKLVLTETPKNLFGVASTKLIGTLK